MSRTNFLYNPERKGKKQLIAEFVIRQNILTSITEDLETSSMKTPEQHYLLIGQRGTGKTTLLNRIRYFIEDSDKLEDWLIPVIFSEEQYNIGELANLWENVAQILEDYHGFEGIYPEMEKYSSLPDFEERCWDILEAQLDHKGKKLVLLIDNIGDLLKKLNELEVRRLRMILQTKPHIRLIAASPLYLESVLDYRQPLFEFFKVIRLEGLDRNETSALLLKLADIYDEKEKIGRIIRDTPERIETLRTLTGGVPRTIALMFNIFIEQEYENSLNDLERILDVVTPLYKHRMDDLPSQQQKIVDSVARNWDPISVKNLKDRVRLESKVISAQLRQLEKNQVVQKMETGTKNHEYILKERFFNIWYLMRYGRKDDRQRVIWLVRFLESWCTEEEIESRITDFVRLVKDQKMDGYNIDFFSEVYSSLKRLSLRSKLLLREEAPPPYGKSLHFSEEETSQVIKESHAAGEYKKSLKWLSMLDKLSESNKFLTLEIIIKLNEGGEVDDYFEEIGESLEKGFEDEGKLPMSLFQVFMIFGIYFSFNHIYTAIEHEEFEEALLALREELNILAEATTFLEAENYFGDMKLEMVLLMVGIKLLYKNGLFNPVEKLFREETVEIGKKQVPLSEIFNPIYLALISLDPKAKKINLAPEKAEIVSKLAKLITE